MKALTAEQIEALERRLRPGGASASGFLAPGQRLRDVLAKDRQLLDGLGLGFAQVADRLEVVLGRAERTFQLARRGRHGRVRPDEDGAGVAVIEPELRVRAWHFAGHQDCPFDGEDGHPCPAQPWASADYELTRTTSGMKVTVPGLLPHLLRAHSFFEGDVPHRVEPARLAQVLALDPGSHAVPEWRTERVWRVFEMSGGLPWFGIGGPRWYWQPALMELLGYGDTGRPRRWDERLEIAPAVTACRAGDWCVLVARKAGLLAEGARLDGSELEVAREVGRGTFQLRRVEQRYVALEGE